MEIKKEFKKTDKLAAKDLKLQIAYRMQPLLGESLYVRTENAFLLKFSPSKRFPTVLVIDDLDTKKVFVEEPEIIDIRITTK